MPSHLVKAPLLTALVLSFAPWAEADVKMPAIFGDHMVLQRESTVPVWGWAEPGENVTVSFAGQSQTATAGSDGAWRVDLTPVPKNSQTQILEVKGKNSLKFEDVLVGDVWLASGQSNMEFGIQSEQDGAKVIPEAKDSRIRFFFVPWSTSLDPQKDLLSVPANNMNGKWQVCSPEVLAAKWAWNGPTAVGYYFARDLIQTTNAPLGLVSSFKGGTPAEAWTSVAGLQKEPSLAHLVDDQAKIVADFPEKTAKFPEEQKTYLEAIKKWNEEFEKPLKEAEAQWQKEADAAAAAGTSLPPKPQPPQPRPKSPASPDGGFGTPGNNFNAMIHPLIPYALKGVIWYQGESNGDNLLEADEYSVLFPRMISDWREKWNQGAFPFLYVQLANFKAAPKTPSEGNWAWVRDAQLKTLSLPKTGMASAVDVGNPIDIHPKSKKDVGARLALAARQVAYGENIVGSGPLYASMTVEGNKIRITFKDIGQGLILGVPPWIPDGKTPPIPTELQGFGIAGDDQQFVWAKAVIDGNSVLVSSDQISKPVAVRYGWADNPQGNLYNKEGLPASPFRTDNWPAPLAVPK